MCNVLYIVACPFVSFLSAFMLSVLQFMDCDYTLRIFKHFFQKQIEKYSIYWVTFELFCMEKTLNGTKLSKFRK